MDHDQESFHDLRRLLALKRHEQPPPGYFETFSQRVILRIQSAAPQRAAQPAWVQWLENFLHVFETRPALAGSFGFAVCAFLATGFLYSEPPSQSPLIANSATFEVPYGFGSLQTTNGSIQRELMQSSLFEEMKKTYPARVQLVNW